MARRKITPFLLALVAITLAFAGQGTIAGKGPLNDAVILYATAALIFVAALRKEALSWEPPLSTSVSLPPPPRPLATVRSALLPLGSLTAALLACALGWHRFAVGQYDLSGWPFFLAGIALALSGFALWDYYVDKRPNNGMEKHERHGIECYSGALRNALQPPLLREAILVLLLTLLAAFLRLYRLDQIPAGCFYDEAMNGLDALSVAKGEAFPPYFEQNYGRGALYIYLIALLFRIGEASVPLLRFASVLVGTAGIPAMYILVRCLFGWRVATIAAFFLAVSRWHINFSRIAFDAIFLPLLACLAFYFLEKGLRSGRRLDFAWSGIAFGLGFHTYAAFRLVPLILLAFLLHRFFIERRQVVHHMGGLAVLAFTALLVIAPLLQYAQAHPQVFMARTTAASIFRGKTVEAAIPAVLENLQKHLLMFNVKGDPNGRHNLPGEPMLDMHTAALAVLGLSYSLWHLRQPAHWLLLTWFVTMLAAGVFSLEFEAPQSLRAIGTMVPAYIWAGLALALVWEQGGMLVGRKGNQVLAGLVLAFLAVVGYNNYDGYFRRQAQDFAVWNAFSTAESLMAREMLVLKDSYDFYVASLYYAHPTVRFIAPQVWPYKRLEATDYLPVRERGQRGIAIFLDPQRLSVYREARRYYPHAIFKEYKHPYGGPTVLYAIILGRDDIQSVQGLQARYYANLNWQGKPALERKEPRLEADWAIDPPLNGPFSAEWTGVLNVGRYGQHLLAMTAPAYFAVYLDEDLILEGSGYQERALLLAKGNHSLRVKAVSGLGRVHLSWQPPGEALTTIPQEALYVPPVTANGLLGRYYRGVSWGQVPALEQIDPALAIYFHDTPLPRPYSVEWTGKLQAPLTGTYAFGLESIDDSWLYIDDRLVVEAHVPNQYMEARLSLTAGLHDLRVRYLDKSGWSHINLYWTPPGQGREIIPAEHLFPPQGAYPLQVPEPTPTPPTATPPSASPPPLRVQAVWGEPGNQHGQFQEPRDIAVDSKGNVYVADTGNRRVQKFAATGDFLGILPGDFEEPLAVIVDSKGSVVVLDSATGWLYRYDSNGQAMGRFGGPEAQFYHPRGLSIDAQDNLYVADTGGCRLVKFSPAGEVLLRLGQKGGGPGEFLEPVDVAIGADGRMWVADVGNRRVVRLDASGNYLGEWAIPKAVAYNGPHLALGPDGLLYVTDPEGGRLRVYALDGRILDEFGKQGATQGEFRLPVGIFADWTGRIYVTDTGNHRVQVLARGP